jgi:hypothetical protein
MDEIGPARKAVRLSLIKGNSSGHGVPQKPMAGAVIHPLSYQYFLPAPNKLSIPSDLALSSLDSPNISLPNRIQLLP